MCAELADLIAFECAYWSDTWAGRFSRGDVVEYSPDFHRFVNRALYGAA